jgi:hypothetical protein
MDETYFLNQSIEHGLRTIELVWYGIIFIIFIKEKT